MALDEFFTPQDVEREMIELNDRIEKAPAVIKEHHNKVREARQKYKSAYNKAYAAATGTQKDRQVMAEIMSTDESVDLDVAEIEYRYVVDLMDSLRTKLRALQSIGSLMKASMFGPQGGL